MGKGDSRTRRGKIIKGSYGKTRRHSEPEEAAPVAPRPAPAPAARPRIHKGK
jgi:ribosomal small subunit protein bTHX